MTLFLVIFSIIGWAIAIGGVILICLMSLVFYTQEARLNEIKSDLDVMTRRANLFELRGENKDI